MLSFTKFLREGSNLAPGELYKYDWRLELFIDKFKKGLPLELTDGKNIVLSYDPALEERLRKKDKPATIKFHGVDNKDYTLGKFAKTAEFGGGGGQGAGSALTKTTESAQAVYCQARWMGKTDYNNDDLETAFKLANVDESSKIIQNELPQNWINSCVLGAEELYKRFGSKQYQFHRGSAWVTRLENTFKKLNKEEKHFSNLNKWSPADIYMVSNHGANIKFEKASNILELNNILTDALKSKDIIGVSLKLLKKTVKTSYYNFGSKSPVVEYEKYTTGNRGFFGAKDIYIYFTEAGKIQFRTFPETFQGEIKGKKANQGKLSYGPIQAILRRLKLPTLHDVKKLRNLIEKNDDKIFQIFYTNYSRYSTDVESLSFDKFKEKCLEKGTSWIFSKFIGCELLDIIIKNNSETRFITACVQYASSSSELSAPFLKLE
jgi:hypothetical protein